MAGRSICRWRRDQRDEDPALAQHFPRTLLDLAAHGVQHNVYVRSDVLEASLFVVDRQVYAELTEEFLPTLNKNDPTYPTRMQGLTGAKQDFATMVAGSLLALTEKRYRIEDRVRLLGYLEETLPAIVPQLLPGSRAETLNRIEKLIEDPSLRELHPAVRRLLGRLQGAAKTE